MIISFIKSRPVTSVLILSAVALTLWYTTGSESREEDKPLIATVSRSTIENSVSAAGSLAASNSVEVGAQVSGQLEELLVEVGDHVNEGQLVARIDASVQMQEVEARRASLQAQEAQLDSRRASVKLAEANAQRQNSMMLEKATSQQEVDSTINTLISAQASLAQLQAQIQQSRASLASAETELGYSNIYAPMTGTVVSITIKEGQTLNANQSAPTVLTIADLSSMTVETDVSEADVNKLRNNMPVYFTTLGGGSRRWYSQLKQILPIPVVTNNVVLYTALFDIDNKDKTLLTGMTAQVFFVTSSARNVLTVPVAALHPLPNKNSEADVKPVDASVDTQGPVREMGANRGENRDPEKVGKGRRRRSDNPSDSQTQRQAMVKVIDKDGNIEEREITVGVRSRRLAEVISGLKEGEQVVAGIVQSQKNTAKEDDDRRGPTSIRGFR